MCLVASIALLPVWWGALPGYRFARAIVGVGALAAASGLALAFVEQSRELSTSLMQGQTLDLLGFVGSIGLLLWCRTHLGVAGTATWFGIGSLVSSMYVGLHDGNPWKYSLAIPVALILLGIAAKSRKPWFEVAVLAALAATSLMSDSRSMTAFFVLTIPAVIWQMLENRGRRRAQPGVVLLWLAAMAIGAYNLFQSLLLEGVLGEAAQQRTQAQIETSGSLITGGRPEAGAAVALIAEKPEGYGAGSLPSSTDIWIAKSGMSSLGYDPNNGYVERYMFGSQFEVHSVLGDLWIRFGPAGALLVLLVLGVSAYGVARAVSRSKAQGVVVYLLLLGAWNMFFGPALPSFPILALMVALTAIRIPESYEAEHTRSARAESVRRERSPGVRFIAALRGTSVYSAGAVTRASNHPKRT